MRALIQKPVAFASSSIRRRSAQQVAVALLGEFAHRGAVEIVRRELLAARRARSRSRFQFWAKVLDEIASLAPETGFPGFNTAATKILDGSHSLSRVE